MQRVCLFLRPQHSHTQRELTADLIFSASDEPATSVGDPDECTEKCEAALDCHMRRFMTSIDAAAEASGQSLAAVKVGCAYRRPAPSAQVNREVCVTAANGKSLLESSECTLWRRCCHRMLSVRVYPDANAHVCFARQGPGLHRAIKKFDKKYYACQLR